MTKPTTLTFRHIASMALERAKLTIAYTLLERDIFRAHRPTAVRHLTDNERRQLARMGHDIGWRRLKGIDNRTVLGSSDVPTATGKVVRIPRVGGLLNHYESVA